jgi:hypothetical protein
MNSYEPNSGQNIVYKDFSTSAVGALLQSSVAPTDFGSIINIPIIYTEPIPLPAKPRIAGLHSGAIWASKNFDEPLSDEFWLGNE